jgi:hypothetical protein
MFVTGDGDSNAKDEGGAKGDTEGGPNLVGDGRTDTEAVDRDFGKNRENRGCLLSSEGEDVV